jgi:hypothetical protein
MHVYLLERPEITQGSRKTGRAVTYPLHRKKEERIFGLILFVFSQLKK